MKKTAKFQMLRDDEPWITLEINLGKLEDGEFVELFDVLAKAVDRVRNVVEQGETAESPIN